MKSVIAGLVSLTAIANAAATPSLADCLNTNKVPTSWISSSDYADLTEPFNLRLVYKPKVVVLPTTSKHVQDAVVCAGKSSVKVQAKSGGHSYASFSSGGKDGSMMIDLQPMQSIKLNGEIATVGGGVRLGNLAQGIWDQGKRALSHGTCPGVGIGGHFTHGGYGHTSRHWGISLDHIVAADVVLANGTLVHATSTSSPEIFWAVRGAADSFGIITNFYLQTHAAPEAVTYFSFAWNDALYKNKKTFTNTFLHIQDFATNATVIDNRISFGIYMDGVAAYSLTGAFFGTVAEFNAKIAPELLRGIPAPATTVTKSYTWIDYLVLVSDKTTIKEPLTGYDEHDTFFAKSITVPEKNKLSAAAVNAFYDYIHPTAPISYFVIINLYGGPGSAINTKDTNFAAYRDRDSLWVLQNYGEGANSVDYINGLNAAVIAAQPDTAFGAYLNYVDASYTAAQAHQLYYGAELYQRLAALKIKVDPNAVFWNPQAIGA